MTDDIPDTPEGWTGPRDGVEAGERWHTGGGIWLREAVHPGHGLAILWNPDEEPVEVGLERVRENDVGMFRTVEQLEATEFDTDADALTKLPDLCERIVEEYADGE